MSVTQEQVVDYIKNLKLGEVKALIEVLEDELGVSASAPVMAVAAGGAAAGGAAEAAEEQTEFDVILKEAGPTKVKIPILNDFSKNSRFSASIVTCCFISEGQKEAIKPQALKSKSLERNAKKLSVKKPKLV